MTPVLLPLYVDPSVDPAAWRAAAAAGPALTVVVEAADRPDQLAGLAGAGAAVLGRVDTGFADRPVADLLDEVGRWAGSPVQGVFFDHAPTSAFCLGPMALATRFARRCGLSTVVLNPGVPTDPLYRELGAPVCTFDGPWVAYRRWSGQGSQPGDGQLVHSVPAAALPEAWELLRQRRAGWGLVTDRAPPDPYAGAPGWLTSLATPGRVRSAGGAGSGGTSTRTGW